MTLEAPEFDNYAAEYDGGADNRLKRLLGDEAAFMAWKVRWLERRIHRLPDSRQSLRVLDFGCGTGLLLELWTARRPNDPLAGVDVSERMLEQAVRRWPGRNVPDFRTLKSGLDPWPEASFDLVTLSCVLHHVPLESRDSLLLQTFRLLKPGGRLCIFEHNPRNALVRWVVRNTAIDRNAILLRDDESMMRAHTAGYADIEKTFILFFPPVLPMLAHLEHALGWLPLGGQYAVLARRPIAGDVR